MSRREVRTYLAFAVFVLIVTAGTMVGMASLGARDELTVVATIGVYGFAMFLGGWLPSGPSDDRR
jgi:hypothetical protein